MYDNFPELRGTLSNCFFCPINRPTPKHSSFTVIDYKQKRQNVTFKRLEPANVTFLLGKKTEIIIIIVGD